MRKIILFICIVLFLFSVFQISLYIMDSKKASDIYEENRKIYHNSNKDVQSLKEVSNDIIGWIKIPNTRIDYPVVKGKDNDYYLNHDINGNENRHGAIFMDYRSNPSEDKNIIIYGHHMKDGTMFKDLVSFKDKNFFNANSFIYLDIENKKSKYEIFSVYITGPDSSNIPITFNSIDDYHDFFSDARDRSLFSSEVEFSEEGRILTLYTCTYEYEDARLIVHAQSVEE